MPTIRNPNAMARMTMTAIGIYGASIIPQQSIKNYLFESENPTASHAAQYRELNLFIIGRIHHPDKMVSCHSSVKFITGTDWCQFSHVIYQSIHSEKFQYQSF
jgi:hypothetical protein